MCVTIELAKPVSLSSMYIHTARELRALLSGSWGVYALQVCTAGSKSVKNIDIYVMRDLCAAMMSSAEPLSRFAVS